MISDILSLSVSAIGAAYRQGILSPVEVTDACLSQIERTEPVIHAWVNVTADDAREAAKVAESELCTGIDRGALHGVPVGIKDIFDVAGLPTRCGSSARSDAGAAAADSAAVASLRAGGAVLLGKTVTQEFAAGVISPPARNPWDPEHIPGGSSGGSAAALAARNCFAAMGSDTGGSIRIPAAACGVVGFKPTYRSLSTSGVYPLSWSLDTVGPLANTVDDARLAWSVLAGKDTPPLTRLDLSGVRIGVAGPFFMENLQSDVREATISSLNVLRELGATVVDAPWEDAAAARAMGFLLNRAETAAVHGAIARENPTAFAQYNADLRLRVAAGGVIPAEYYVNSLRLRHIVRDSMAKLFRDHRLTALVAPTLPTVAPSANDMSVVGTGLDEGLGAAWTRLTMPFNTTGQPALAIPVGFDASGLPIGIQLAGVPGRENDLFAIGSALERALDVCRSLPPLLQDSKTGEVSA